MAHFQKNLLEAFQDANDERAGGDPASAGPFAGTPPDEPEAPARTRVLPALSTADTRLVLAFAGFGIVTFVLGLAVGRALGGGEVAASGPDRAGERTERAATLAGGGTERAPAEEVPVDPAPVPSGWPEAGPEMNAALEEPANRYAVLAVTYGDSETEKDLAFATYYHFADQGLPVAYPRPFDGRVYVLVGAAPERSHLLELRDVIRSMPDPDGRPREYDEAYIVGIDRVIPR